MRQYAEAEEYDDFEQPKGPGPMKRWWERITGHEEFDEEEDEVVDTQPEQNTAASRASGGHFNRRSSNSNTLQLSQARRVHVTVRRAVHSFDDARRAADGLKDGLQQIVNLEQTPADMAERITDFLNGATYALDGSVEKIGEQVYLFTPSTVTIDIEDRPAISGRTSFLDRE